MGNNKSDFVTYSNEIIFALVQPTGTDLSNVRDRLTEAAHKFNATIERINLTDFIDVLDVNSSSLVKYMSEVTDTLSKESGKTKGFKSLSEKMHHGTNLRKHFGNSIFSIYGMAKIHELRTELMNSKEGDGVKGSIPKKVYLLDSLKNPEEVDLLREIYGNTFWLLGVSAEKNKRSKYLQAFRGLDQEEAAELIARDEDEDGDHGQKMIETFERSDFFFSESATQAEIDRFFNIAFGNIKIAPQRDEQFMHVATSIAAQSSDLSRQVGAVIISNSGELLGLGCNDVPKFPGGQYKEGDASDYRDITIGHDPNHRRRDLMLDSIGIVDASVKDMIKNLTEYHRAVHAEMEALISCARRGVSTVDSVMYTTTYPCHNCAKHLLNAGIKKVFYIQAYTKSLATSLHNDAISEDAAESKSKMVLIRYVGIGPRKYLDHFSLTLGAPNFKRKGHNVDRGWKASVFNAQEAIPPYPLALVAASSAEKEAMKYLLQLNVIKMNILEKMRRLAAS